MELQSFLNRETMSWVVLGLFIFVLGWQLFHLEQGMLYYPNVEDPTGQVIDPALKGQFEELTIQTSDGETLNAWYFPPKNGHPTAVLAHGNAGSLAGRQLAMKRFVNRGFGMLAFDYRGYGKSTGTPSEKGLYRDLETMSDFLVQEKQVPVAEQIAVGESLGGAVVIDVASRRSFRAVLVYGTFTSVRDMAIWMREGWIIPLPLEAIVRQPFASIDKIERIQCPLVIAHGDQDATIPPEMSQVLFEKAVSPAKVHLVITGAGHNDVFYLGGEQMLDELENMLANSG